MKDYISHNHVTSIPPGNGDGRNIIIIAMTAVRICHQLSDISIKLDLMEKGEAINNCKVADNFSIIHGKVSRRSSK